MTGQNRRRDFEGMAAAQTIRMAAIVVGCVALAILLGLQALSGALTRKAPAEALAIFPLNGEARAQLAFDRFREGVSDPADGPAAAREVRSQAMAAVREAPLEAKAYALIALASEDPEWRRQLVGLAAQISRRDLALQGQLLELALAENDYPAAIASLDQTLRVHPELREQFFPLLLQALEEPEAESAFAELLDGTSSWHEAFAMYALRSERAQLALAGMRATLPVTDANFDRRLIRGLAEQGEIAEAKRLYDLASASSMKRETDRSELAWDADFPPFDWQLVDQRDFRAQPDAQGDTLEIYARAGRGGTIARRIVGRPDTSFALSLPVQTTQPLGPLNLRIELSCAGLGEPFLDEPLRPGRNTIKVVQTPDDCPGLGIAISARALSGEPTLRAKLRRISISGEASGPGEAAVRP